LQGSAPAGQPVDRTLECDKGPRCLATAACKATDKDDTTEDPRFGRVGKQTIRDTGPISRKRRETAEEELLARSLDFMDRTHKAGKPFLLWHNTTRMHVWGSFRRWRRSPSGIRT
jgi:arylsulfatase A-like enzyme